MTRNHQTQPDQGFTLIELILAIAIICFVVVMIASIVNTVSGSWKRSSSEMTSFQNARFAFDRLNSTINQSTLNPYWDYVDASGTRRTSNNAATFAPSKYARCSDQHFMIAPVSNYTNSGQTIACFFQAPLGYSTNTSLTSLNNMLNAVGFFVEFNSDGDSNTCSLKPSFAGQAKWRYRLMELRQPSENNSVFTNTTNSAWITNAMTVPGRQARPIADNIIALVLMAEDVNGNPLFSSTNNSYTYDSRNSNSTNTYNQLPAQVQVTMVAIDEASASRLAAKNGSTAPSIVSSNYFQDPANYTTNLASLQQELATNSSKPTFRVFSTSIRIEAAKWSQ